MTTTLSDRPRRLAVAAARPASTAEDVGSTWALAALLIGTAVAYLWDLGASGWANSFYSAAVQAGSESWKAFFFGSSDAANSITVDKPPASLWLMALSVRVFGLSSWTILVPQALLGVGSVALLWATVRRLLRAAAGLLAGLVLALTPVRGADVPVQQPGRAAGAADDRRRVGAAAWRRGRAHPLAGAHRRVRRVGLPDQAAAGDAGRAAARADLPASRAAEAGQADLRSCSPRWRRWSSPPAGGC